jgi:hypothetical protein
VISRSEAEALVQRYVAESGVEWLEHEQTLERAGFWYFPVGHLRSIGVVVDRDCGRLTVLDSKLCLDDALWAHARGFSPVTVTMRVTRVVDPAKAIEFLLYWLDAGPPRSPNPNPRRAWLRARLAELPCDFPREALWSLAPLYRRQDPWRWFDFELVRSNPHAPIVQSSATVPRTESGRPAQARDLKLRRPAACARCGAGSLQRIVYGHHGFETLAAAERGEIMLGSCIVHSEQPDWHCRSCGHSFFDETDPARRLRDSFGSL